MFDYFEFKKKLFEVTDKLEGFPGLKMLGLLLSSAYLLGETLSNKGADKLDILIF
jgi:hypothetical protein